MIRTPLSIENSRPEYDAGFYRGGMSAEQIGGKTVAFFYPTRAANVAGCSWSG